MSGTTYQDLPAIMARPGVAGQPNHDNISIRTQGVIAGPRHGLDIPAGSEAERSAWQARGAGDESESCHDD